MSEFRSPLDTRLIDDQKDLHALLAVLIYVSTIAGMTFAVPTGFVTDFASVPRLPLVYWLVGNIARPAAVIHDYLYATGAVSREIADAVFLEAMEVLGIPAWKRYAMYGAVRSAGWMYYNKPKAHQVAK